MMTMLNGLVKKAPQAIVDTAEVGGIAYKVARMPQSGAAVVVVPLRVSDLQVKAERILRDSKPSVPMIQVEVMGEPSLEENPHDPDYVVALQAWHTQIAQKMNHLMIRQAARRQIKTDEMELFAAEERAFYKEEGIDLEGNDVEVWLNYHALASELDLAVYGALAGGQAEPTAEGIAQFAELFRRQIQGA